MLEEVFPVAAPGAIPPSSLKGRRAWLIVPCLFLLALSQMLWAGYRLGVGNQGIQIALLGRWADPALFPRDAMVNSTIDRYPSYFFRGLARLLPHVELPILYFSLHLLTTFATLWAAWALGRAMFQRYSSAAVLVLLLLAGHHSALGGEDLYSAGFTHTWAVFPLAIAALGLFYRGSHWAAFLLAGLIFNLHALTGGYLAAMLGVAAFGHVRAWGIARTLNLLALLVLGALPTLHWLAQHRQSFDAAWLNLTHIRSAEHSFPSTWWQMGNTELPRFALLAGLAIISMGFPAPGGGQRKTRLLALGAVLLFAAGFVFAEWLPVNLVIRAQLLRASRLLAVILLAHIAHAIACGFGMLADPGPRGRWWRAVPEALVAAATLAALAAPQLVQWIPLALVLAVGMSLAHGRLSWRAAGTAAMAALLCIAAWDRIGFAIPLVGTPLRQSLITARPAGGWMFYLALGGAAVTGAVALCRVERRAHLVATGVALLAAGFLTWQTWQRFGHPADDWSDVQRWAQTHTPAEALFLTPSQPGGFRTLSQRSVVCEWRDGTQLYFSADYAGQWWSAIQDLQPGLICDAAGRRLLAPGRSIDTLDDDAIVKLCQKHGATHVVLPATRKRNLPLAYRNGQWAVYLHQQASAPATMPAPLIATEEQFMQQVVQPNIEKYRKGDAKLRIVDPAGRPIYDLPWQAKLTRHDFRFSGALNFFVQRPNFRGNGDFWPTVNNEAELKRFPEVFNFSLIPFSGKWMYIEPKEGQRDYADLDQYVDWCTRRNIGMEFHFLSGYPPPWFRGKSSQQQGELFLKHATDLAQRYGDRIEYWQVVNETILIQHSPAVFRELRRIRPNIKLGISDCSRFFQGPATTRPTLEEDAMRGLKEIRWLKQQGIKLDFFGFHGHRPFGLWPDARQMYLALDAFAAEGVKLHISEFTVPMNEPILGPIRKGAWTPELQAEFYVRMFTICFSHPSVEMMDLWGVGPNTWQPGSGLLDANYQPKPVFFALRDLIHKKWSTEAQGTLALGGSAEFRGFYGDYELSVTLPDGQVAKGTFSFPAGATGEVRLVLDRDKRTISR